MSVHESVIETRQLSVYHRSGAVFSKKAYCVRDLTLHVHRNEIVGLAGPSGSGKTSIGKAILGLIPTWDGDVYWNGYNIRRGIRRSSRRAYGWISQESTLSFNPSRKIIDVLHETLSVNGVNDDRQGRIRRMCEYMKIDQTILQRHSFEMSGGQIQRCALMRVLMLEPEFLLLDEPTSSLDTVTQLDILRLLLAWKREHGLTMIFISHSRELLKHFCHRIIDLGERDE